MVKLHTHPLTTVQKPDGFKVMDPLADLPVFGRVVGAELTHPQDVSLELTGGSSHSDFERKPGSILLIDKPLEWTSFDVIRYLRSQLKIKKMGHAGTLDPKATGLLVCCCGPATKRVDLIQGMDKRYEAEILFGQTSPSYDLGTPVTETAPWEHITLDQIRSVLESSFTGVIQQVPPMYSAIKSSGRRLYDLARKGEVIHREPRPVQIYDIQILAFEADRLALSIRCGKGTYIRSIARDLARELGSCGMLARLRRTSIGPFKAENALSPQQASEQWGNRGERNVSTSKDAE